MMGNLSGGAPEGVPLLFLTDEYFSKFPLFFLKTLSLEFEKVAYFVRNAHPFQRNEASFRLKLSKVQIV